MKLLNIINPFHRPEWIDPSDELLVYRERIAQSTFLGFMALFVIIILSNIIFGSITAGISPTISNFILFSIILIFTFLRTISFKTRLFILIGVVYFIGVGSLILTGGAGDGRVLLLAFAILSTILFGIRGAVISDILVVITNGIILGLISTNSNSVPVSSYLDGTPYAIPFALITILCTFSVYTITAGLENSVSIQKTSNQLSDAEHAVREKIIQEKDNELQDNKRELKLIQQLTQLTNQSLTPDELCDQVCELVQREYGFSEVRIFLLDDRKEYLSMKSAADENGLQEIPDKKQLKISEHEVFGNVIQSGEYTLSIQENADHLNGKYAFSPNFTTDFVFPINGKRDPLGILDIKSTSGTPISSEELSFLQTIIDQFGSMIKQIFVEKQLLENVSNLEANLREFTAESWRSHIRMTHKEYSYKIKNQKLYTGVQENSEAMEARITGQSVIIMNQIDPGSGKPITAAAIPIKLRQQVLGVVNVRFESQTIPSEVINTIEAYTNRLSLALENVRLMETIQIRADREHMVANISDKVRATTDVESILRTAANELGRSLGVTDVVVQLCNSDQ